MTFNSVIALPGHAIEIRLAFVADPDEPVEPRELVQSDTAAFGAFPAFQNLRDIPRVSTTCCRRIGFEVSLENWTVT